MKFVTPVFKVKLFSFFFAQKITEINSSINGKIEVVEQFGKRAIRVEGLEQSGPMVERIWEKGIKKVQSSNREVDQRSLHGPEPNSVLVQGFKVQSCLILGLGGGSAVKIINKYFPQAKILGIEIDPIMIELGRNYLGLSEYHNLIIKVCDAFKWLEGLKLNGLNHLTSSDLILVDLHLGKKTPLKIETEQFLRRVKQLLTHDGVAIFNRLRGKREEASFKRFLDKLKKVYHDIKVVKPVANYLIICQ